MRISLSMIFSIVGRRDIGLWPLPPGFGIGMTIEVFQSLGIRPSLQDWLNKFRKRGKSTNDSTIFRVLISCYKDLVISAQTYIVWYLQLRRTYCGCSSANFVCRF